MLYGGLSVGGYLIVDDYFQIDPCRQAVDDFRREHGITEPIEAIDWNGARWRVSQAAGSGPTTATPVAVEPPRAMERKPPARVMAFEEVELRHELVELAARLAAAEAELAALVDHPLRRLPAWVRRRLQRILRGRA
jgi:hypothetical protein